MISLFSFSCILMALVYVGGLMVYRRNGPSSVIGRFSNLAVIVYGVHLALTLITFGDRLVQSDAMGSTLVAVVLLSPFLLARVFNFQRAGFAMILQILILTAGGLWLRVIR